MSLSTLAQSILLAEWWRGAARAPGSASRSDWAPTHPESQPVIREVWEECAPAGLLGTKEGTTGKVPTAVPGPSEVAASVSCQCETSVASPSASTRHESQLIPPWTQQGVLTPFFRCGS